MLTIARLKRWSVNYYNDTARAAGRAAKDAAAANAGLGEYYSEKDTRTPVWRCAGDSVTAARLCGLSDTERAGGEADPEAVARWLDDGIAPNEASGRAFSERANHGFDLTFCAPKSVSLARAFGDDVTQKALQEAHNTAVAEALEYLSQHAGYTRVHNPQTGKKDLVPLPGLVIAAYQHETSRAGDPHLHTHALLPNRQPRADGKLVSIDSDSLWHEAKAAGVIYQATLRRETHRLLAWEWGPTDPATGMAELAGVDPDNIGEWSQRKTQMREWSANNLVLVDDEATAAQLAAAQKATRPRKPEGKAWAELLRDWHADERGFAIDRDAQRAAAGDRRRAAEVLGVDPRRHALAALRMAEGVDKAAFTRADLVEVIGAQLPVDIDGDPRSPREQIEALVDTVAMRITETRAPHHREGNERYTIDRILAEEATILGMLDAREERAVIPARLIDSTGLSAEQARVVRNMAVSPWLIQPLQAPAGAGKTHSLSVLRDAAHRAGKRVVVLTPTGAAVDVAMAENAGDEGHTVDLALKKLGNNTLRLDTRTLVIVDEAGTLGTPKMRRLLEATTRAGAKTLLIGDSHQLAPVKARGGMLEQLSTDAPWSQELTEVWRMRDPAERVASLALRHGGAQPRRRAVAWYRDQDRLHTGDQLTMADDALTAYRADRDAGKDALLICDTKEMTDALNRRLHDEQVDTDAPTVTGARGHRLAVGDTIITTQSDYTIATEHIDDRGRTLRAADPVRNGNRWTVTALDAERGMIAARRLSDGAIAAFGRDYYREHITHGYATTVQGSRQ